MPSIIPSRRRGKLATAARTARRLALIRAAAALVQTRLAGRIPGRRKQPTVTPKRVALLGGLAAAVGGLLGGKRLFGGGGDSEADSSPAPAPPAPSNYDASGPPANTATPVPAPDLATDGAIDEEAEVAAAAAEAANIGGGATDYAGAEPGEHADAAERPLAEAGEGVSEGEEQADADLADNATDHSGPGEGMSDAERQIDEAIEATSNPASGETPEPAKPGDER